MLLDIVILPSASLRGKIGKAVKDAAKRLPYVFIVDNKKLIPHLSLFHLQVTRLLRLKKVIREVEIISKRHSVSKVKSLHIENNGTYLGIVLSNNHQLRRLNQEVIQETHFLGMGTMPWIYKRNPSVLEKKNRKNYGTQYNIRKNFQPHFTLAIFKNSDSALIAKKKLKLQKFTFLADTIAVCEVNWWHQVTHIIKTFKLKK